MRRNCNGFFYNNCCCYCCCCDSDNGVGRGPDYGRGRSPGRGPGRGPDRGRSPDRDRCRVFDNASQHDKNRLRSYRYRCYYYYGNYNYCYMTYKSLLGLFFCGTRYLIQEETGCYKNMSDLSKMYDYP